MENASKALIIAGAILLSILLISLGIMIFNQAQDTVNNTGMSEAEIVAFNNKFLKYEGIQSGSVVRSLLNEVLTSNVNNQEHRISVRLDSDTNVLISTHNNNPGTSFYNGKSMKDIETSSKYEVKITNHVGGYVSSILIEKK